VIGRAGDILQLACIGQRDLGKREMDRWTDGDLDADVDAMLGMVIEMRKDRDI
jgi:hypothetical protein